MEGVEILSIGEIGVDYVFNWAAAIFFGCAIGGLVGIFGGLIVGDIKLFFIAFLLAGLITGIVLGSELSVPSRTIPTYKVSIDDTVSLNDFYEKYEALEQEGKIFTVKERTE